MAGSPSRSATLDALDEEAFDVLIVGGGINGAVSAAALAAHGARVALVERGDFAGFTSSHSSNLAWGGIKYMESYEFGLVRKLCRSRNELLRAYPSAVREIRFFTVLTRGSRFGRFMLYVGALLYWVIGAFYTRPPKLLSNATIAREEPGIDTADTKGGIEYSDAYVVDGDAHFVFRFVRDAIEDGAVVANYVESLGSTRDDEGWSTRLRDRRSGRTLTVRSRVVVNACGPYVEQHNEKSGMETRHRHLYSKGVHLVVERIPHAPRVLTFFATDGRLFFVLPLGHRSSIGTTDTRVDQLPAVATAKDRAFILDNINQRLGKARPLTEHDIIAERCGVRPLVVERSDDEGDRDEREGDDWTQLSRKHALEVDAQRRHLCIFGGKLTDCINVGEEVVEAVAGLGVELRAKDHRWYGEADASRKERFMKRARGLGLGLGAVDPDVGEVKAERWWRRHGPRAEGLLEAVAQEPALAQVLIPGTGVTRAEARYAAQHEMVVTLEDFLRRRTLIEQVVPAKELRGMPQLRELSEILFGEQGPEQLAAYLGSEEPVTASTA